MNTIITADITQDQVRKFSLENIAPSLVISGLFLLMLSVSLMDKLFLLSVALVIFNTKWRSQLKICLKHPVILSSLPLIFLFTLGLFYSKGFGHDAFHMWDKYLKILYPLFLIPLFIDPKFRTYAIKALMIGIVLAEVLTYLRYFKIFPLEFMHGAHWFVHDIDGSFIIAFMCYVFLNFILDEKKYRWWYVAGLVFISFDLFFLNEERTGYLVFTGLCGLLFLQRFGKKGFLIALFIIPLVTGSLYLSSKNFHNRVNMIFSDISGYSHGISSTSIGARLAFAEYSFKIIKSSPLLGSGTGSFKKLYQDMNGPKLGGNTWPGHPHNEYIFIVLQIGLIGFFFFWVWIFFQIRASLSLPLFEKRLLQGIIFGFLLLSMCNSSLALSPGSNLYVILLAILLPAKGSADGKVNTLLL